MEVIKIDILAHKQFRLGSLPNTQSNPQTIPHALLVLRDLINIIIINILTLQASIYFVKINRSLSIVFLFSVDEIYGLVCKSKSYDFFLLLNTRG